MRIVHLVCSDRFAGVERYISYVSPVLAERGHEVMVLGGEGTRMRAALQGPRLAFSPTRSISDAFLQLSKLRHQVDLVHVHMTDAELAGVLTRPFLGAPVVATLHFAQQRGSSSVRRAVADLVARGLASQIAISRYVAEAAGVPEAVVVPNGVPWTEPVAPRAKTVLVAQRLEREKDGLTAVRAWSRSGLGSQGWRLKFAGEGRFLAELRSEVQRLGEERTVELVGNIDGLSGEMARSSIFLATAPAEPFGLSVVEAMAAGLPVVAAGGGAHLETCGPAVPDLLFPPGSAEAAADVLCRLASSEQLRESVGSAMRRRYLAEYTIDRHVDRLLQVYARS